MSIEHAVTLVFFASSHAAGLLLSQPVEPGMNARFRMTTQRLCLALLLLAFGMHSAVLADCDLFSATLERLNAEEKKSLKQARKKHVEETCGHESQSWNGGAAGRRRFEYLNCKLSARNSEQFKQAWAMRAVIWQARREQLEAERLVSGCAD